MLIDRLAAAIYHASPSLTPDIVLKRLGIATSRRRVEFYTLERVLSEMPAVRGSVLECGVYRGATLLGMTHILTRRGLDARVFGFDSFEGFPEPTKEDAQSSGELHPDVRPGALSDTSYRALVDRIRLLDWDRRITLVKGFFENTLHTISNERFSLVHLDCDLYTSYKTCLEFVYPRMLAGSAIVLDDYRLPANVYPGADRAVDEFFADKPEKPERFDHPQGLRSFVRVRRERDP
jgi:hypothetical protein